MGRLTSYGERHRRLLARLTLIVIATVALDLLAAGVMYLLERHARGTEIKTFGQALDRLGYPAGPPIHGKRIRRGIGLRERQDGDS